MSSSANSYSADKCTWIGCRKCGVCLTFWGGGSLGWRWWCGRWCSFRLKEPPRKQRPWEVWGCANWFLNSNPDPIPWRREICCCWRPLFLLPNCHLKLSRSCRLTLDDNFVSSAEINWDCHFHFELKSVSQQMTGISLGIVNGNTHPSWAMCLLKVTLRLTFELYFISWIPDKFQYQENV